MVEQRTSKLHWFGSILLSRLRIVLSSHIVSYFDSRIEKREDSCYLQLMKRRLHPSLHPLSHHTKIFRYVFTRYVRSPSMTP